MKNANELREELSKVFDGLKKGELTTKEAAEFSNIAGKMINSAKAQVEYYAMMDEKKRISFLEE